MEKRMNKDELKELINSLKIDKQEFWVLSSGALVLRNVLEDAGDLDIAVTNKGLEQLKQNYNLKYKPNGWFIINNKIEGVCNGSIKNLEYKPETVENINVQNIVEYYNYLINSDRDKDKARIEIVKKLIKY